jgi:hypothetical protein
MAGDAHSELPTRAGWPELAHGRPLVYCAARGSSAFLFAHRAPRRPRIPAVGSGTDRLSRLTPCPLLPGENPLAYAAHQHSPTADRSWAAEIPGRRYVRIDRWRTADRTRQSRREFNSRRWRRAKRPSAAGRVKQTATELSAAAPRPIYFIRKAAPAPVADQRL